MSYKSPYNCWKRGLIFILFAQIAAWFVIIPHFRPKYSHDTVLTHTICAERHRVSSLGLLAINEATVLKYIHLLLFWEQRIYHLEFIDMFSYGTMGYLNSVC